MRKSRLFVIVGLIVVAFLCVIGLILAGHWLGWETGFGPEDTLPKQHAKTLWDWLQLLIIPAVLAVGGYLFTYTTSRNDRAATEKRTQVEREAAEKGAQAERGIALDNQREAALQEYIDKMSELLLEKHLRYSVEEDEVRKIARVRTLTILPRLDSQRKGNVVQFLYESGLIDKDKKIIVLKGADLSEVNLSGNYLFGVNLSGANLRKANLKKADLGEANLSGAHLLGANLRFSYLIEADLRSINLSEANLNAANLDGASLEGAHLIKTNLRGAYLRRVNLFGCVLLEADLRNTNLIGVALRATEMDGVYLDGANLSGADINVEKLKKQAISLKGTTMPDGTIHP